MNRRSRWKENYDRFKFEPPDLNRTAKSILTAWLLQSKSMCHMCGFESYGYEIMKIITTKLMMMLCR
jgi:hypothetical protein